MNEIFKVSVSLSISGTFLMMALILIRMISRKWTSKCWRYYIWLVIIARLLLPFSSEASVVGNAFVKTTAYIKQFAVQPQEEKAPIAIVPAPISEEGGTLPNDAANEFQIQSFFIMVFSNLWIVWLLVALIMLVRKITIYQSFVKYVRAGSRHIEDIEQLEALGQIAEKEKVRTAIELSVNNLISSPMLIGFFKPCIVLPTTEITGSDFSKIMLHEITHYKRRDMFYKWLIQFTICLHWFNPFVYMMSRSISRDCELACDEAVMRTLDAVERRSYGNALLNAVSAGGYRDESASVALGESKELLKERLDAIMQYRKKSKRFIILTIFLTALLLCGFAFSGAYQVNALADGSEKSESAEMEYAIINGEKWYFIVNETQLRAIADTAEGLNRKYLLGNDIRITSDWIPIGTAEAPFTGTFDGNGSTIRGLTMKNPTDGIAGLFGYAKGAVFHNIELVDVDFSSAGQNLENKNVKAICAVPIDCKMTDNRVYQLENSAKTVEMETLDFGGKTYYLVFTEEQLRAISAGQYGMDKNFMQQADIQMSTDEWIPIGTYDAPFTGVYNGNGYEIQGLTMKNPYAQIVGLFGYAKGAQIYNITMRNYDILSAGTKADNKGVAPIVVYPMEKTKVYDNFVYPMESEK